MGDVLGEGKRRRAGGRRFRYEEKAAAPVKSIENPFARHDACVVFRQ